MALVGESTALQRDLVFDFGFHRGEDTGHYLAMGHRVVAVDASAELIAAGRERFAAQLASGQLTLVHGALIGAAQRADTKELLFYPHPQRSEWGSVDLRWVRRNAEAHGLSHAEPVHVPALCLVELVERFGCPQFLKIDIEGADAAVLADLARLSVRPEYVSWETGKESLQGVIQQHQQLKKLGYGRFRVVQQAYLEHQPPAIGASGEAWHFEPGCSGLMPSHSYQRWRSLSWVSCQYLLLFVAYRLVGPRSWFRAASRRRSRWIGGLPRRIQRSAHSHQVPLPGWVDSHARLTLSGD